MADTREPDVQRRLAVPQHESSETQQIELARYRDHSVRHRTRRTGTTVPLLLGRAIFGGYFLYNGINHFVSRQMLTEYARGKRVPAAPIAVAASGLLLVAGGLSLVAGVRPKAGASLVTTFLLGVSPQMHAFWKETDPQQRMHELVNFTKNMALVGGAMLAAAVPEPWPYHFPTGTRRLPIPASALSMP
jgi:putative oxidoreductase